MFIRAKLSCCIQLVVPGRRTGVLAIEAYPLTISCPLLQCFAPADSLRIVRRSLWESGVKRHKRRIQLEMIAKVKLMSSPQQHSFEIMGEGLTALLQYHESCFTPYSKQHSNVLTSCVLTMVRFFPHPFTTGVHPQNVASIQILRDYLNVAPMLVCRAVQGGHVDFQIFKA